MALPLHERVTLAQALWESIEAGLEDISESAALKEAVERDKALSSGTKIGRSQADVIRSARRAIGVLC